MMRKKRERKMRFLACLGSAALLSLAMETTGVEGIEDSAEKKTYPSIRSRLPASGSSFDRSLRSNVGMGKIWDKASRLARSDIEALRLLHDVDMMSMSLSDSSDGSNGRPPTAKPISTPKPSPAPTRPDPDQGPTPSCSESTPRNEYIFDRLKLITDPELLMDQTTPQGKALNFLVNDDAGIIDHCSYISLEQRYGLVTFFFATNGGIWKTNSGWLGDEHECFWYGVDCDDVDSSYQVTRLLLPQNNLVGSLTNEIRTLEKLERFDVYSNNLTGTIPKDLSALSDLVLLDLEDNQFTGRAFSDGLFDMTSLVSYRISNNLFTGSIPPAISKLNKLCQIWAAANKLTGSIPKDIAASGKLESLLLYENQLSGSIPEELGMLGNLYDLQLQTNKLENGIPSELFSATDLEILRLDFNFLTGGLPSEIGNLQSLKDFRLDQNSLFGTIPPQIGALSNMENFVINNNFWTGTFPDVFQDYTSLDFFDIANSQFKGKIPESLFEIPTIRIAYFSNNTFTGTIPQEFSGATLLRDLFLDGNDLTGTVPGISEGQLPNLSELLLQFNQLSGSMPESICDLREGNLIVLFSDCGGPNPEFECKFDQCCNRCFEGGDRAVARRKLSSSPLRYGR